MIEKTPSGVSAGRGFLRVRPALVHSCRSEMSAKAMVTGCRGERLGGPQAMSLGRAVHQKARSPARNAGSEVNPRPTQCVIKRGRRGMAWSRKPRAIRRCLRRRSRARTSRQRGTASNSRAGLSIRGTANHLRAQGPRIRACLQNGRCRELARALGTPARGFATHAAV